MTTEGGRQSRTATRGKARAATFVFLASSGLWLLWSGHFSFEHPLLLALGLASVTLVVFLCWRMGLLDEETIPLQVLPRALGYLPWLLGQIALSCVDVLRRGLTPSLDIDPRVLRVEGSQKSDLGLVIYANSITMTPGTVSMDSDVDSHTITVHALSGDGAENLRSGDMDRRVSRVEGE